MNLFKKKKYKILKDDFRIIDGVKVYRIQALKSFANVKKGDLGGFIQSEANLSQQNTCWIYDVSVVKDEVKVLDDAKVFSNSILRGVFTVEDACRIADSIIKVKLCGSIKDGIYLCETNINSYTMTLKTGVLNNNDIYATNLTVIESSLKYVTCNESNLYFNNSYLYEVKINNSVTLNHVMAKQTEISSNSDIFVFLNNWSSLRYFNYVVPNKTWYVGCFIGSGEELIEKAYKDSELSGKMYEKYVKFIEKLNEDKNPQKTSFL